MTITANTDVPSVVAYGKIIGHFVSFLADTADVGNVPDEIPLSGWINLAPQVSITQWPTAAPPRLAVVAPIRALVIDGDLYPPDATGPSANPGVFVVATDQPVGQPNVIQWTATFGLTGVSRQPGPVTFNVPAGGVVDLSQVVSADLEPAVITVVSSEDVALAQQAVTDAQAQAALAASSAAQAAATAAAVPKWWTGTQAAYDALAVKDPNTLYLVVP